MMAVMVIMNNYYINRRMTVCLLSRSHYNGCHGKALKGFSTLIRV
jgi:hypothetical protein